MNNTPIIFYLFMFFNILSLHIYIYDIFSNGESVMDNVYLKPGFTAFETAEKFCREKDLDKVYSENGGMNPLHDNKCVLPITYELQKRSRSLCYKNPDHVLSLLIDVTNEEDIT